MNMKKLLTAGAVMLSAALVLTGCAGGNSGGGSADSGGPKVLKIGAPTPPVSLDPLKAAGGVTAHWYEDPAYAGLLDQGPDSSIVAGLAEEWGYVGDDNKRFELKLREGLKFADGTPLTSTEVVASLNYFVETSTGPSVAYFRSLSFETDGELGVVVTSETPNPLIDTLMTARYAGGTPISPAGIADPEATANQTFGAGPYVLDTAQTVLNDTYVYVPNENYWDQDAIHWDKVEVRAIPDRTQLVQALRTGQVDVIEADSSVAGTIENNAELTEISAPARYRGLILLDRDGVNTPYLSDVRVRQALNFAVDRVAITKAAYGDHGSPTVQPTIEGDPALTGYDASLEKVYPYDPEKARELLADAGYADGITLPVFYQSFEAADTLMIQAVASQLAEVGVTLDLKPTASFGDWVGDLSANTHAATVLGTGGPIFLTAAWAFMPGGVMNSYSVVSDPAVKAFEGLTLATQDEVASAARALNATLVEEALSVPISQVNSIFMFNHERVSGVEYQGTGQDLSYMTTWVPNN